MEEKDITEETGGENTACCCSGNKGRSCGKLDVYDWLNDVIQKTPNNDMVEVRFKNTRKDYFQNVSGLSLKAGDIVAVEGSPGHDIGVVTLTGRLVKSQMIKNRYRPKGDFKTIYRKAKPNDIEKWQEAIALEHSTMIRSRQIVTELGLAMKIGDVEYQGDKTKGIFYYIAEGRVDFRELIKVLASNFKVRIEMKQIGARQEAGRIGGIGPCGRDLCCSSWMTNFKSVSTGAARTQEVSLNPQKLAGQCSKLKCCLNYELDTYEDARKDFPSPNISLETEEGKYNFVKSDTFKRIMFYYCNGSKENSGIREVSVDRVNEVIALNKKGEIPKKLVEIDHSSIPSPSGFKDVLSNADDDSLTRFDKPKRDNNRRKNNGKRRKPGEHTPRQQNNRNSVNKENETGEKPNTKNDGKKRNIRNNYRNKNNRKPRTDRNANDSE